MIEGYTPQSTSKQNRIGLIGGEGKTIVFRPFSYFIQCTWDDLEERGYSLALCPDGTVVCIYSDRHTHGNKFSQ